MTKRNVLKELLNGNATPLQKLVPAYDLDRLTMDELEALGLHHMGITVLSDTELERITAKAFSKPLTEMSSEELARIAGVKPVDLAKLSDEQLRNIIKEHENKH